MIGNSRLIRTALIAAVAAAAKSQNERPRPMTPDPITTAREALPYVYHPGVSPKLWAESLAKVNAAFDYAEKLKAERDEARDIVDINIRKHVELIEEFDLASDEIARLTSQLEQAERVIAPFASMFGDHEYIMKKTTDLKIVQTDEDEYIEDIHGVQPIKGACLVIWRPDWTVSTIPDFQHCADDASQWIKDHQAKTDHLPDVGNMVAVQPVLEWSAAQLMYNGRVIGFVSSWFWGVANSISGWKMVLCGQEIDKFPYEDGEKWGDLTTYNKARCALETAARQWLSGGDK